MSAGAIEILLLSQHVPVPPKVTDVSKPMHARMCEHAEAHASSVPWMTSPPKLVRPFS